MLEIEQQTADIVCAYLNNNTTPAAEIPALIATVHAALSRLGEPAVAPRPEPACDPKRSIHPDYLVCLEDGKKLQMLKRWLRIRHNMSPEEYRQRWELPPTYPMVAPNYAARRSELAKQIGLGKSRAA